MVAGAAVLLVYPLVIEALFAGFGVRPVGVGLIALAAATLLLGRPFGPDSNFPVPYTGALRVALLALLALAVLGDDARPLLGVPAAVQVFLAAVFARSALDEHSILERVARRLQPRAPEFIGPYCRAVTWLWAALFAVNAAVLVALASDPAAGSWRAYAGLGVWLPLGALSAFEYVFRKVWFRHYGAGPIDRLWARWLPAERTSRGRRSLAHIRRMHDEMRASGFAPPSETGRG
jgi:uncharacterized membrane protein